MVVPTGASLAVTRRRSRRQIPHKRDGRRWWAPAEAVSHTGGHWFESSTAHRVTPSPGAADPQARAIACPLSRPVAGLRRWSAGARPRRPTARLLPVPSVSGPRALRPAGAARVAAGPPRLAVWRRVCCRSGRVSGGARRTAVTGARPGAACPADRGAPRASPALPAATPSRPPTSRPRRRPRSSPPAPRRAPMPRPRAPSRPMP